MATLSTNRHQKSASSQEVALISKSQRGEHVEGSPIFIRNARHVVLELYSQLSVWDTISVSYIHSVETRAAEVGRLLLSATYDVVDLLRSQPFNILLSNFFAKAMKLPEQVVVAYAKSPPTAMTTPRYTPHQHISKRTPDKVYKSQHSDAGSADSDADTANGEKKVMMSDLAGGIGYKSPTAIETQL